MSKIVPRALVALVLLFCLLSIRSYHNDPEGVEQHLGKLILLYFVIAIIVGFAIVSWVIPWISERIGTMMYSSGEEPEPDPRGRALALVAQGDYEGAIDEFRSLMKDRPDDRGPVVEIAKIYQDRLHNAEAAISTFEQALAAKAWPDDDRAFFLARLADINLEARADYDRARALLQQIQSEFPESRHSANATHRLHEVDQAEFKANQG